MTKNLIETVFPDSEAADEICVFDVALELKANSRGVSGDRCKQFDLPVLYEGKGVETHLS